MDYESHILQLLHLPPILGARLPDSRVKPVGWHSYDREKKLLCISDGGSTHLKDAYSTLSPLIINLIGNEIGTWLATLHLFTVTTPLALDGWEDRGLEGNNPVAVHIYRHSYRNLHTAISELGHHDAEFARYIDGEWGGRLEMESECICHGDFWPGNVLVSSSDTSSPDADADADADAEGGVIGNGNEVGDGTGDDEKELRLTVVDWEMTRRGTSATDVAQFAAESFLLDRFRSPSKSLLPVFLDAYAEARLAAEGRGDVKVKIDREWVRRMAVHWGVHIAFWPTRVQWAEDREGKQALVDIGVEVLKAATEGNWEKLRKSELFKDVGKVWNGVLGRD